MVSDRDMIEEDTKVQTDKKSMKITMQALVRFRQSWHEKRKERCIYPRKTAWVLHGLVDILLLRLVGSPMLERPERRL